MKSASLPPSLPNVNEPTEKDADSRRYVFPKEPARESFASTFDSQAAKGVPNKRCFYEAPATPSTTSSYSMVAYSATESNPTAGV